MKYFTRTHKQGKDQAKKKDRNAFFFYENNHFHRNYWKY